MREAIAVIGTAGRRTDAKRINRALYDAMYEHLLAAIREWDVSAAVSGGAAVADHLAVRAFLEGAVSSLHLFLPAEFKERRYVPDGSAPYNPGATSNRYHQAFSEACGINSLSEIAQAIECGAITDVHPGFHTRNMEVAASCTHMIAFTFGPRSDGHAPSVHADFLPNHPGFSDPSSAGLRDGGTAHTWSAAWKPIVKRHVRLDLIA